MKKIIWTESELKKIKQIILLKSDLKVNEDFELVPMNSNNIMNNHNQIYNPRVTSIYQEVADELIKLFYIDDRNKINEVLTKASLINVDFNNRLHIGIISTLAKMKPENHFEIFNIFKEIVAQYNRSASVVAHKIINELNNIDLIKEKINEIKNSDEETIEEKMVKNEIRKVFLFSNGVTDDEIFASLISTLDNKIKIKLLTSMNQILIAVARSEIKNKNSERITYSTSRRFQQRNMDLIKKQKIKI